MTVLIDTHIFLWFINDDPQLNPEIIRILESESAIFLSIASLWEIAIKVSLGKLKLSGSIDTFLPQQITLNQITILPIAIAHLETVSQLPYHHRDPFDRLIIAQSLSESLTVISGDQMFDLYSINLIRN